MWPQKGRSEPHGALWSWDGLSGSPGVRVTGAPVSVPFTNESLDVVPLKAVTLEEVAFSTPPTEGTGPSPLLGVSEQRARNPHFSLSQKEGNNAAPHAGLLQGLLC